MGIRYYAYAFDADQTDRVMSDPRAFISRDPLADAWGLEPGAQVSVTSFERVVPERDALYLDKAWRELQLLTRPSSREEPSRPAFSMFDGDVTYSGLGWTAWCRALAPEQLPDVARDLAALGEELGVTAIDGSTTTDGGRYVHHYLARARGFVERLVVDGRSLAYLIG